MADKINIELDESFINKLFELTDALPPALDKIDLAALKGQLRNVSMAMDVLKKEGGSAKTDKKDKAAQSNEEVNLSEFAGNVANVQKASDASQLGPMNYNLPTLQFIEPGAIQRKKVQHYDDNGQPVKGKILVIDDLGIITYQLSVILKRAGYLPITSKEIYDALDKYKRSSFDFIITDLFIPTEREGFILIEELQKIAASRNETPLIAVMSASSKKEHKQECQKKGAAFYVEKVNDWQKELFGMFLQYENQENNQTES